MKQVSTVVPMFRARLRTAEVHVNTVRVGCKVARRGNECVGIVSCNLHNLWSTLSSYDIAVLGRATRLNQGAHGVI